MEVQETVEQPVQGSADAISNAHSQLETAIEGEAKQPSLTDLEKLERFTFQGKEWTPQELKSAYMAHADYTRKTQALAQERKFMENLEADLDAIRENPQLVEEFRRIYPQTYHKYLKYVEGSARTPVAEPMNAEGLNPEVSSLKSEVQQLRDYFQKMQMKELETQFSSAYSNHIKSKYPWVDEDRLAGLAREALSMGYKLRNEDGQIDQQVLEQIAKFENERLEKKFQEYQKQTVEKQRAASRQARDIGSGGGIPGQAPRKMSFKEATEAMERDLMRQG